MAVARSSSGGVAIRCDYVGLLPVLWIISRFFPLWTVWIHVSTITTIAATPLVCVACILCRRLRAPRLDESFVLGVSGAESAMHQCLVYNCQLFLGRLSTSCVNPTVVDKNALK